MQTVLFLDVLIEKICASGVFFQARRKSMVVKFMFAVDCVDRQRRKWAVVMGAVYASLCRSFGCPRKENVVDNSERSGWRVSHEKNTPLTRNSYVCGVHFPEGAPDEEHDAPCMFCWEACFAKANHESFILCCSTE